MSNPKGTSHAESNGLLARLEGDSRLNAWHMALVQAILYLQSLQGNCARVLASRRRLMSLSHIRTLPTYHKYFKELQDFGYISYSPSYHPSGKSEIVILPALQCEESLG